MLPMIDCYVLIEELQYHLFDLTGVLLQRAHNLASAVLPLWQLFEFMRRKNSVIRRVCMCRTTSGMLARRQKAALLMLWAVVLFIFAVRASVCMMVLVHPLHIASVIPYA